MPEPAQISAPNMPNAPDGRHEGKAVRAQGHQPVPARSPRRVPVIVLARATARQEPSWR